VAPSDARAAIQQLAMPDLTVVTGGGTGSLAAKNAGSVKAAQSLKVGSVMDILGGNFRWGRCYHFLDSFARKKCAFLTRNNARYFMQKVASYVF
jgi:hypothetical protein